MTRLKQNESIKHIMTKDVESVLLETPLSEVGRIFRDNKFHHLPVVKGHELVGIISYLDLMRVSFEDSFGVTDKQAVYEALDHTLTLEKVMTPAPATIQEDDSVKHAAEVLAEGSFHALPVVDSEHGVVGMVTSADVIRYLVTLY